MVKTVKKAKKRRLKKKVRITLITIFLVGLSSGLFLLYGPYSGFRDYLITTAMTTMNHQYLATIFYSDKTINKVLAYNKVIEPDEDTNLDLIDINDDSTSSTTYKDKYDKEVLTHEKGEKYKIIKFRENGYDAYLAVIYDPSKIKVVTSKYLGYNGQYLTDMAKENNALVAINGSGFLDPDGVGTGGLVQGIVIKNGEIISSTRSRTYGGGVIGFTEDNKLYLGDVSAKEAVAAGVRDAVEFGPFLVVNGKSAVVQGNGGYGIHPRTAIGQRKDGIVLFLVIDGRRVDSVGASVADLAKIMLRYGAYNAANLDGGNSSVLVVNNKIVNRPINWSNMEATRPIATGFILQK